MSHHAPMRLPCLLLAFVVVLTAALPSFAQRKSRITDEGARAEQSEEEDDESDGDERKKPDVERRIQVPQRNVKEGARQLPDHTRLRETPPKQRVTDEEDERREPSQRERDSERAEEREKPREKRQVTSPEDDDQSSARQRRSRTGSRRAAPAPPPLPDPTPPSSEVATGGCCGPCGSPYCGGNSFVYGFMGALGGGVLGGAASFGLGVMVTDGPLENRISDGIWFGVGGALAGAIIGGVSGGLVGMAVDFVE